MFSAQPARPYFEAWLRRTRRQLAVSGRLTQTALLLSREMGGSLDEWREKLREYLDGERIPTLELLTRIDALLAGPGRGTEDPGSHGCLFDQHPIRHFPRLRNVGN